LGEEARSVPARERKREKERERISRENEHENMISEIGTDLYMQRRKNFGRTFLLLRTVDKSRD